MGILTFPAFLTFLLPLIFSLPVYSLCPTKTCANSTTMPIRFPFRLQNQQPDYCSYPGFNLSCTDQGLTAVTLPNSGQFLVRYISYSAQAIRLYDQQNCLPRRLLDGFDTSGSPFRADSFVNFTFLRCPRNFTDDRFTVIECLSNSTTTVMATPLSSLAQKVSNKSCEKIRTLPVPIPSPQLNGFTSSLIDDILLTWDLPDCKDCEARGGVCGLQTIGSLQVGCFYDGSGSGDSQENSQSLKIFRIIAFSIAIPAILSAFAVGIYLCVMDRRYPAGTWTNRGPQQIAVTPQPQETAMGLDQATIDSYTKVVLGESRRVPGLNDGSCPICLSDFSAKETLRCIPDCRHCFHADCIDEWLRMNGSCPLCRTSPAHDLQV